MSRFALTNAKRRPLKVTHVIGSLEVGGAEQCLCGLASGVDPAVAQMTVIALVPGGPLALVLAERGIHTDTLSMRPGRPDPRAVFQLARRLRRDRPDLVVTWMYHANLIGGLAAKLSGHLPIVWNIRHTRLDRRRSKRLTRWTARAGGWLSRAVPDALVYVADAAAEHHSQTGYQCARTLVIPNGFDLRTFRPDPSARAKLRHELGLPGEAELVGLAARFHPDKDHRSFLAAAGRIHRARPQTQFVLAGQNVSPDNRQLVAWAQENGVCGAVHLLGRREDMPGFLAALDVAVCSSLTEAFPRAVGEAMACAVPCAVTDVGDAARLVGATGRVVPSGDSNALAGAVLDLLGAGRTKRQELGRLARQRIAAHFSLDAVLAEHLALWQTVATKNRSAIVKAAPNRRAA